MELMQKVAQKYLIEDHLSIAYLEPQIITTSTAKKEAH